MKNRKTTDYYQKHSVEFTRRQFLYNAGYTAVASYLTLNNLPQIFASKAYAASTNTNLPFVALECYGGINIAGNVIVGRDNSGTQDEWSSLDSYMLMGFPPDLHPSRTGMVDDSFGIKFHATSGILIGLKQVLDGKTILVNGVPTPISQMVDGLFFAYRSTDDTDSNPINTSIPVVKAGASGRLVNLIGTTPNNNGGNSLTDPAVFDPLLTPPLVDSESSAKGLVSLGSSTGPGTNFDPAGFPDFMSRMASLSKERFKMMSDRRLTSDAKANIERTLDQSSSTFTKFTANTLTPMSMDSADLNTVFSTTPIGDTATFNSSPLSVDLDKIGTISYLLLHDNLVGAAMIMVGGGDYHDGTARVGIKKDIELGRYIGEIFYYAALKGKSVALDLFSDGSAICDMSGVLDETVTGLGRIIHTSDSPVQSGSMMMVYRHGVTRASKPIVKDGRRQVGYFLPGKGGGVDLVANTLANDINLVWKVKMLNYIALMENTASADEVILKFESIYGRGLLPTDAKDMIRFNYIG